MESGDTGENSSHSLLDQPFHLQEELTAKCSYSALPYYATFFSIMKMKISIQAVAN